MRNWKIAVLLPQTVDDIEKIINAMSPKEIKELLPLRERGRPSGSNDSITLTAIAARVKPKPCSIGSINSFLNGTMTTNTLLPLRIRAAIVEHFKTKPNLLLKLIKHMQESAARVKCAKKKE